MVLVLEVERWILLYIGADYVLPLRDMSRVDPFYRLSISKDDWQSLSLPSHATSTMDVTWTPCPVHELSGDLRSLL
jgi:hypothetical protein